VPPAPSIFLHDREVYALTEIPEECSPWDVCVSFPSRSLQSSAAYAILRVHHNRDTCLWA
jgi:hypothetical protein